MARKSISIGLFKAYFFNIEGEIADVEDFEVPSEISEQTFSYEEMFGHNDFFVRGQVGIDFVMGCFG